MGFFERFRPGSPDMAHVPLTDESIAEITDQTKLADIARNDNSDAAGYAVKRLDAKENQDLLIEIVRAEKTYSPKRKEAVKKMLELGKEVWEPLFVELVQDPTALDHSMMLRKLDEADHDKYQDLFAAAAQQKHFDGQLIAISLLDMEGHEDILRKIADDPKEIHYVKLEAAKKFDPAEMQQAFIDIALSDPGENQNDTLIEAIERIDPDKYGPQLLAIALTKVDQRRFRYTGNHGLNEIVKKAVEVLANGKDAEQYLDAIVSTCTNAGANAAYEIMKQRGIKIREVKEPQG